MASSEQPAADGSQGSTNPDIQALMNLSESIGEPTSENKSPWNFSQNQPVFKQPMSNPPPIHRVSSSEPEFRVPVNPPYRPVSDLSRVPHVPPEFRSEGKVKERLEGEHSSLAKAVNESLPKNIIDPLPGTSNTIEEKEQTAPKESVDEGSNLGSSGTPNVDDTSREESVSSDASVSQEPQESTPQVTFTVGDDEKTTDSSDGNVKPSESKDEEENYEEYKLASRVFEYKWPQERGGDYSMLQEQVSEYLKVLSFKRKHPDLTRRPVEYKERIFLRERGVVTETQCDLGLTVLKSDEVLDLIVAEYPQKYTAFAKVMQERERLRVIEQRKIYEKEQAIMEKNKLKVLVKKSVRSAAEYNAQFMRERREERRAYFDLQTQEVHYPISKRKILPPEKTNPGAYPLALIPGQYQNHYHSYTPQEKKYLPINTAVYSPPRALQSIYVDPDAMTEGSDGEERNEKDTDESSSSSSESESGTDDSQEEEEGEVSMETEEPEVEPPIVVTIRRGRGRGFGRVRGRGSRGGRGAARSRRGKLQAPEAKPDPLCEGDGCPEGCPPEEGLVLDLGGSLEKETSTSCSICKIAEEKGDDGDFEAFVQCSQCKSYGHPKCLDLSDEMVPIIKTYAWQCMECKNCAKCLDSQDEDKMMFCDHCDRGFHTFCVGLKAIPTGRWECPGCRTEETPPKKRGRPNAR